MEVTKLMEAANVLQVHPSVLTSTRTYTHEQLRMFRNLEIAFNKEEPPEDLKTIAKLLEIAAQ